MAAISASALAYTFVRAAVLSFTHDESLTYLHYVLAPLGVTFTFDAFSPANNHLLNTLLMRGSAALFGDRELALRLPSWLGLGLYIAGACRLVRRFRSPGVALATFVLLLANPFLLDFFSLARGYGLGLGFTLAGLYALLTALDPPVPAAGRTLLAFALLACAGLANFAFLDVYLAAAAVFGVVSVRRPGAFRALCGVALLSALYLAAVVPVLLKMQREGELYLGGKRGFFADTVESLVRSSLYGHGSEPLVAALGGVAVVLFLASAFLLWRRGRGDGAVIAGLTAIAACGIGLQHRLFGTPFATDRSALFFVPLFVLTLGAAADRGTEAPEPWRRLTPAGALAALAALLVSHTLFCANLTYTDSWRYDADTGRMLADLAAQQSRQPRQTPEGRGRKTLGVSWLFEPAVNFYIQTRGLDWLQPVDRAGLTARDYDYYFYEEDQGDRLASRKLVEIERYPVTGNVLARRGAPREEWEEGREKRRARRSHLRRALSAKATLTGDGRRRCSAGPGRRGRAGCRPHSNPRRCTPGRRDGCRLPGWRWPGTGTSRPGASRPRGRSSPACSRCRRRPRRRPRRRRPRPSRARRRSSGHGPSG